MPKISLSRIVPLLTAKWPVDGVQNLLREIIVLQAKLDDIDKQDFYFQKGRKSNERRLDDMKVEYSRIVELVNGNDVDYFLEQIKEAWRNIKAIEAKGYLNSIGRIAYNAFKGEDEFYEHLIQIKGQYNKLKTLDELMNDKQVLMDIFE